MSDSHRLAGLLQERLNDVIAQQLGSLEELGPDVVAFLSRINVFLEGGKRLRARFSVLGAESVHALALEDASAPAPGLASAVLDAACALELFHAAALVHDDIIDRSDTRRGHPAMHEQFASSHREQHFTGSAEHFGLASALLIGDLLQSWADALFQRAVSAVDTRSGAEARLHFDRMRNEVTAGQYLDVLEEARGEFAEHREQLERSTRVLVYKSAKYSVEAPLLIGAALAGGGAAIEQAFEAFGLPIGVAFQLRDDLLGVFGDEAQTGKPSGDDLREGKRTVLVTLARESLPSSQRRIFDDLLGSELEDAQVTMLQGTIRSSGAVDRVEEMIARNVTRALDSLDQAPIRPAAEQQLRKLAQAATMRHS